MSLGLAAAVSIEPSLLCLGFVFARLARVLMSVQEEEEEVLEDDDVD